MAEGTIASGMGTPWVYQNGHGGHEHQFLGDLINATNLGAQLSEGRAAVERASAEVRQLVGDVATRQLVEFGKLSADVLKLGFEGQLAAERAKAEILSAVAECCCEQKELVRAEAGATRALIQSTEAERLRIELVDAKAELAVLRAAAKGNGGPGNS